MVVTEPLAILLRSTTDIQAGAESTNYHSMQTICFYLSQIHIILSLMLWPYQAFSCIPRYKLNLSKSELFPINHSWKNTSFSAYIYTTPDKCTYLGVVVSRNISELFQLNFTPLLEQTRISHEKWSKLPISLIGRINVIKMNYAPYIFIFVPNHFTLRNLFLNKILLSYLWNKKPPEYICVFCRTGRGWLASPKLSIILLSLSSELWLIGKVHII